MNAPLRDLPSEVVFKIGGMTCANCAIHVRKAVERTDGVAGVQVDLSAQIALVRWRNLAIRNNAQVIKSVQAAGYEASLMERQGGSFDKSTKRRDWPARVLFAFGIFLFLMISEWTTEWHRQVWFGWLAFAAALPVQVVCGGRFYIGAWRQLKLRRSNMDTLVSLGSTSAFAYSVFALFSGSAQVLYFMESVGIIAFVGLGHWIEGRMASKAAGAVESLLSLTPDCAKLLREDGAVEEVEASSLRSGQRIQIAPAERIAVDGKILQGASACDESTLTGESLPIEKSVRQSVYAGTLNLSGSLIVEVNSAGRETALARIIAAVERAQHSRAEIQKLADQISNVFCSHRGLCRLGNVACLVVIP